MRSNAPVLTFSGHSNFIFKIHEVFIWLCSLSLVFLSVFCLMSLLLILSFRDSPLAWARFSTPMLSRMKSHRQVHSFVEWKRKSPWMTLLLMSKCRKGRRPQARHRAEQSTGSLQIFYGTNCRCTGIPFRWDLKLDLWVFGS